MYQEESNLRVMHAFPETYCDKPGTCKMHASNFSGFPKLNISFAVQIIHARNPNLLYVLLF